MPEYVVHLRSSEDHPKQDTLVNTRCKRMIVKAGRRGGKTVGTARLIVERFLEGRRIVYGAPTGDQLETCWFEVVQALREPIDAGVFHKDETEHSIERLGTKQRIRLKTAYNADTWRGDYGDLLIYDEWQLMNEDAWHVVGAPMLMDNNGDAVFLYTPPKLIAPSRQNTISKARDPNHASMMFKAALLEMENAKLEGREPRWFALTWKSRENPFLEPEGLINAAKDMTSIDYMREIEAEEVSDDDMPLREEWIRYFSYRPSREDLPLDDPRNVLMVRYEKREAEPTPDEIHAGELDLRMIVDPNHAGKQGRCKHAICVVGFDQETSRFHLLDEWAESCGYRDMGEQVFKMAAKWGLFEVWIETVASQVYCKLYLAELNDRMARKIRFKELPHDGRANAKDRRIEGLEPYFRNGQYFVHRSHKQFKLEYGSYYRGKRVDVDLLDCMGYCPQLYTLIRRREVLLSMQDREREVLQSMDSVTGY
jgi:hypothetical protein